MNESLDALLTPAYHDGLIAAAILAGTIGIALVVQRLVFALLLRVAAKRDNSIFAALIHRSQAPAGFAIPLLAADVVIPELHFPEHVVLVLTDGAAVASIIAIAWGVTAAVGLYSDLVKRRYSLDVDDNLRARQVATRIDILARAVVTIVFLVAAALVAMTFPPIRAIGTTLLASAGVAGLAVGLAARPLFENLVAGVQIALTQPIRIDDVVIVETEYGHVEKIGATYVVVRLWDQRRMILPLTYFIEKPFQNWTYTGAALIGSIMIYTDYSVPVEDVRAQVPKILASSKKWDGAVQNLQVTDATETTMQMRILVSARNSADLFDVRCEVREALIAYIAATYPSALPQQRQMAITP